MGARGELFTTQVFLDNRSYFFNVKENRTGDIYLQIVESKNRDGAEQDRHQIAVFSEDMQKFLQGMDKSLEFIEKARKEKQKAAREKKALKEAKYGFGGADASGEGKKMYRIKAEKKSEKKDDGIKRTGRVIHVTSKKAPSEETPSEE